MEPPLRAAAVCVAAIISHHRPNVLPLRREIDLHVSPAVTESLDAMTERKLERIVIDLSRTTYIDSAGLAALILAMQKVMCSIFETSRLNQIFQIFPDVDAALAASTFCSSPTPSHEGNLANYRVCSRDFVQP